MAIAKGDPVRRYGQIIGYALEDLRQGSWVQESQLAMPAAPALDSLPRCSSGADIDELIGKITGSGSDAVAISEDGGIVGVVTTRRLLLGVRGTPETRAAA